MEFLVRNRFRSGLLILTLVLILAACGDGDDSANSDATAGIPDAISTQHAWIRPAVLPEGSPTVDPEHDHEDPAPSGVISALYMTLQNNGSAPIQLTGVETDVARVVEMHQTQNQNGLMQMRPVPSIEVPDGGEVVFEPGGFHIMLIDVNRQLEPGDEVAVTLIFESGERLAMPAVPVQESGSISE